MDRRRFIVSAGMAAFGVTTGPRVFLSEDRSGGDGISYKQKNAVHDKPPAGWLETPAEFSLCPFWFWNDELSEKEIARQIKDFRAHGPAFLPDGFVIHPRAGLPTSIGWMSENMIKFMRFAIEQAAKHGMWVVLYDEGMYPSGSSSGQVVEENAAFRTRGLFALDLDEGSRLAGSQTEPESEKHYIHIGANGEPELTQDQNLVAIIKRRQNGGFCKPLMPGLTR